jgi:dTDP-4-dehydrorhamnose reductase
MLRVLLIGNTGQLGWELARALAPRCDLVALDYPVIDLADERSIRRVLRDRGRFQVIINAAAHTAVDRAESEKALTMSINAHGPRILAEEASHSGAMFVHYSTDYVFDGAKGRPYVETDEPNPLSVYGESKLLGEQAIEQIGGSFLILRTAWVYSLRGDSFVNKVLLWATEQRKMRVVADQISNPTWTRSLAEATARILYENKDDLLAYVSERKGLYHLAGDGFASRFEWAKEILKLNPRAASSVTQELWPSSTAEYSTPAKRPLFSALDCQKFEKTFGYRLPPWKDALFLAMQES